MLQSVGKDNPVYFAKKVVLEVLRVLLICATMYIVVC